MSRCAAESLSAGIKRAACGGVPSDLGSAVVAGDTTSAGLCRGPFTFIARPTLTRADIFLIFRVCDEEPGVLKQGAVARVRVED